MFFFYDKETKIIQGKKYFSLKYQRISFYPQRAKYNSYWKVLPLHDQEYAGLPARQLLRTV